jgi:hypothetical protein
MSIMIILCYVLQLCIQNHSEYLSHYKDVGEKSLCGLLKAEKYSVHISKLLFSKYQVSSSRKRLGQHLKTFPCDTQQYLQ